MNDILNYLREFNIVSMILRLALAFLCGGMIGMERGKRGRAAGLRTHILVCLGAAMTVMTGLFAVQTLKVNSDPLRIGAQVISGIGFLGVGTILITGNTHVKGLTTAAGLWTTAAIGLAIGIGYYEAAIICTAICVLTIVYLSRFENVVVGKNRNIELYIEIKDVNKANEVVDIITSKGNKISRLEITPARSGIVNSLGLEVTLLFGKGVEKKQVIQEIAEIPDVSFAIEIK
ncbi:MAG TPA: MgtC/SapB family protein [Bacillota bacterium]|nr:MgtC/SapB family protein [Bacillota bacterium]HPP84860.1 MgtC/SapB family protein [Bacillota bacterium]